MPKLKNKRIILIDDGIATGASIKAALLALDKLSPKEIILAIPVLPASFLAEIKPFVTKVVYLSAPEEFYAVGSWYDDFAQVSDNEVIELLNKARQL